MRELEGSWVDLGDGEVITNAAVVESSFLLLASVQIALGLCFFCCKSVPVMSGDRCTANHIIYREPLLGLRLDAF